MTEILITSSFLIIALLIMRKLFGKSLSRRVQYALWALVLIRLLVPMHLPAMDFSVVNAAMPVEETVTENIVERPLFVPVTQEPLEKHPLARKVAPEHTPTKEGESVWIARTEQQTAVQYKRLSSKAVLTWIWRAGGGVLAAFLLAVNLRFWFWLRKVRRPYEVKNCKLPVYMVERGLPSPCLFGLFRPAIYLTPAAAESEESLRHVLAHELTHARHLDHLWIFLRWICLAVYWFDPLVWIASSTAKKDCELACDEGALAKLAEEDRIPYGETLLSLIPVRQTVNPMLATTAMTAGKKHLKDRISRIAKKGKQTAAAVLAVSLLTVAVSACTFTSGDSGKVVVCFDVSFGDSSPREIESFLRWLDDCNKYLGLPISSEDVEIELIPRGFEDPAARSTALQRLRAEIMAGRGPDLFVCSASSGWVGMSSPLEDVTGGRLFSYPEKMRESGMFLPLDDLLPDLTLTNVDDLIPQVLESGKNQAGEQVMLPLTFSIPGIVFPGEFGEELPQCDFEGTSWYDVLQGDDLLLREQVNWIWEYASFEGHGEMIRMGGIHNSGLFCLLPKVADFDSDTLGFSEEELSSLIKDSFAAYKKTVKQETPVLSKSIFLCPSELQFCGIAHPEMLDEEKRDFTFAPLRNLAGGSTAIVTQYCAVNANTNKKEKAMAVIDVLLYKNFQTGSPLYDTFDAMPMNRELCSPGNIYLADFPVGGSEFTPEQYDYYLRALKDINVVRFISPLDVELNAMMKDIEDKIAETLPPDVESYCRDERLADCTIADEEIERIVSEHYQTMQRLLDES